MQLYRAEKLKYDKKHLNKIAFFLDKMYKRIGEQEKVTSCFPILLYILSTKNAILFKCFLSYFSVLYNLIFDTKWANNKKILVTMLNSPLRNPYNFLNFYNSDIFCDEDGTREFNKAYVCPACKCEILIA